MGICRCNKRRVTQSFCFEHKVNVCEFCMVNNHQSCIIQPYLQWLEDCSYNAKCSFCQLNLSNEECVRLLCYHVFHWTCLNKFCSSLPLNTAPAGYTCSVCQIPIFPSNNTPSPIYTALKKKLSTTEWARIGLGLPISTNNKLNSDQKTKLIDKNENLDTIEKKKIYIHHDPPQQKNYDTQPISINNVSNYLNNHGANTMNNLNNNTLNEFNSSFNQSVTRNKFNLDNNYSTDRDRLILDIDDEHKYRQRSSINRLFRYLKFFSYKHSLTSNQRSKILITSAVLGIFFIFYLLVKWGRSTANNDPLLNPKYDPNIHLGQDIDNFN